jgi:hypothetical protein
MSSTVRELRMSSRIHRNWRTASAVPWDQRYPPGYCMQGEVQPQAGGIHWAVDGGGDIVITRPSWLYMTLTCLAGLNRHLSSGWQVMHPLPDRLQHSADG